MSVTMPQAVRELERFNGELLELESHLFDLLTAMQLRRRRNPRPRPAPKRRPQRQPRRHPSGGFPGYLFGGRGGEQGIGFPEEGDGD
jgi:hypothetical protein